MSTDNRIRRAQLNVIRQECRRLVSQRSLMSAGAAIIPVPGLDMGADVAILMRLLPIINEKFGLDPQALQALSPREEKLLFSAHAYRHMGLIGGVLTPERILRVLVSLGAQRLGTRSVAKYIPLVGSGLSAGVSYYLLRRLGHAHIEECYTLALRAHEQGLALGYSKPVITDTPTRTS